MAGVSELLFRHDTADCFAEACLNHDQSGSVMDPFTDDDDLEVCFFFLLPHIIPSCQCPV